MTLLVSNIKPGMPSWQISNQRCLDVVEGAPAMVDLPSPNRWFAALGYSPKLLKPNAQLEQPVCVYVRMRTVDERLITFRSNVM